MTAPVLPKNIAVRITRFPGTTEGAQNVREVETPDDAFTFAGRVRDAANDRVIEYADGTAETLYYTAAGLFAGKSVRA